MSQDILLDQDAQRSLRFLMIDAVINENVESLAHLLRENPHCAPWLFGNLISNGPEVGYALLDAGIALPDREEILAETSKLIRDRPEAHAYLAELAMRAQLRREPPRVAHARPGGL